MNGRGAGGGCCGMSLWCEGGVPSVQRRCKRGAWGERGPGRLKLQGGACPGGGGRGGGQRGADAREKKARSAQEASSAAQAPKPQAASRDSSRKLSYKQKFALESLPGKIEEAQAKLARIEAEMADPNLFAKDPAGFASRAKAHDALKADIEAMETEWMELEILREEIEGN